MAGCRLSTSLNIYAADDVVIENQPLGYTPIGCLYNQKIEIKTQWSLLLNIANQYLIITVNI